MRNQLNKLRKCNSTKAERIFAERLKLLHIKFRTKVRIAGREIDFLIGKYAIDIDGHKQDTSKNSELVKMGYIPMHFDNNRVDNLINDKLLHYGHDNIR